MCLQLSYDFDASLSAIAIIHIVLFENITL